MTNARYESLKFRASYQVTLKFPGLNKMELYLLYQLSGVLESRERQIIAKSAFFQLLTGNNRMKMKLHGYYYGLVNKGFVGTYEYIGKPGSLCLGISELGLRVVSQYDIELNKLASKDRKGIKKHGVHNYRPIPAPNKY